MIAFERAPFRLRPLRYGNGEFREWSWLFFKVTRFTGGGVDDLVRQCADAGVQIYVQQESQFYRHQVGRLN